MHAIVVQRGRDQPRLVRQRGPDVQYRSEEVLVRVWTTAANRADLLQAGGLHPPPPGASAIHGLEMTGEVLKIGRRVFGWKAGDRGPGSGAAGRVGYARQVAADCRLLPGLPGEWSFARGAAWKKER
jgi:NADPH:quinone reductase-like Zn-dependent oxidoreductase